MQNNYLSIQVLGSLQTYYASSARQYLRSMALLWNFHPYDQRTSTKASERCSSLKDLNGFQYNGNYLRNLLIAGSMNGHRS